MYYYDKQIFNYHYSQNIEHLTSEDIMEQLPFENYEDKRIQYNIFDEEGCQINALYYLEMIRRNKKRKGHWNVLFEFAKKHPGLNIEQLIEIKKKNLR